MSLGGGDVPLRQPHRAHEPRIARDQPRVVLDLEVVVVRVASDATAVRLVRQLVGDRVHRVHHARIVGRVHAEPPQPVDGAVEHGVDCDRLIVLDRDPPRKPAQLGAVEVAVRRFAQSLCGAAVTRGGLAIAEQVGEVASGVETAPDRPDRERVHAPPLLPEVPGGQREPVALVDVADHPVSGRDDERRVEADDEVKVAVDAVVLPQRPQDEPRLVLLHRQRPAAVRVDPRQPRAARLPVRRVLVQEEAFFDERLLAEEEELPRHVFVSRAVERVGDDRAVPRPRVGVGVAGELRDVEVARGDHGAAVVDMRPRGEDAAPVELRGVLAKLLVDVAVVFLGPYLPVRAGPTEICVRPARGDQILPERCDLAEPGAHAQPVIERARFVGGGGAEVERDGAVDGALFDRVLPENAVLRVDPRAGRAVALLAVGPAADAVVGTGLAADQEVTVGLVRDHRAMARLVEDRVADVRALDVPVVVEENTRGLETGRRRDRQVADEPVAGEVDVVLEGD